MTDVIILKRIPGHRAGAIVPLTKRLEQHVKAGNARKLPSGHAWDDLDSADAPTPVLTGSSTGSHDDLLDAHYEVERAVALDELAHDDLEATDDDEQIALDDEDTVD